MKPIRLMFVDDQKIFIAGLTQILKKVDRDIKVVAAAGNGREAVEMLPRCAPDIVAMDIRMPVMNGVEAVKLIHRDHPEVKVIMLTTYDDDEYVKDALKFGASGYLLKDIPVEDLVAQIRGVCTGSVAPLSQSVLERLAQNMGDSESARRPEWLDLLSRTERRILKLIVEGNDNREIAAAVFLAEQTVRNYVHRIYETLHVENRTQAIRAGRACLHQL